MHDVYIVLTLLDSSSNEFQNLSDKKVQALAWMLFFGSCRPLCQRQSRIIKASPNVLFITKKYAKKYCHNLQKMPLQFMANVYTV